MFVCSVLCVSEPRAVVCGETTEHLTDYHGPPERVLINSEKAVIQIVVHHGQNLSEPAPFSSSFYKFRNVN
jgi:hypothetical protein